MKRILLILVATVDCGVPGKPVDLAGNGGPAVTVISVPPAPASSSVPVTSAVPASAPTADAGPPLCGCQLCAPVASEDACTGDADCAPAEPCHATRCVGKAKAKPRLKSAVCTMMLVCDSIDANACGCRDGRCSLYPRAR